MPPIEEIEPQDRAAVIRNMPATMPIRDDFTLGRFISNSFNLPTTKLGRRFLNVPKRQVRGCRSVAAQIAPPEALEEDLVSRRRAVEMAPIIQGGE